MSRDFFDLGDQVWINSDVRVGDHPIGGRICTVRGVHKGMSETGLSLTDRNNELMCVNQNDVTRIHRTAVRVGDAIHTGTELAWSLLFWGCVLILPALFAVWGARLVFSTADWAWGWELAAAIPTGAAAATVAAFVICAIAAIASEAGDSHE